MTWTVFVLQLFTGTGFFAVVAFLAKFALDRIAAAGVASYKARLDHEHAAAIEELKADLAEATRLGELNAERKLQAHVDAYVNAKRIDSAAKNPEAFALLLPIFEESDEWLWKNRFFLSDRFFSLWLSVRNGVLRVTGDPMGPNAAQVVALTRDLAEEAILEIYKAMGREKLELDPRMVELLERDNDRPNSPAAGPE